MKQYRSYTVFSLRVTLGLLFAYFGWLAVTEPARQLQIWVAGWAQEILFFGTSEFIFVWGCVQLVLAAMLILGIGVRYAALGAALALLGIVINLGLGDAVAYRDIVLFFAALMLFFEQEHALSLDARLR